MNPANYVAYGGRGTRWHIGPKRINAKGQTHVRMMCGYLAERQARTDTPVERIQEGKVCRSCKQWWDKHHGRTA